MYIYIGKSVCETFGNGHKAHLHQKEIYFHVRRCSELADDLVQKRALLLEMQNLQVLLSECLYVDV